MAGFIFHVGSTALCPHAGQVTVNIAGNPRVFVSNQPVATTSDVFTIAGCSFMVGQKPQPCITLKWLVPATRIKANGRPVILQDSVGLCQSAEQIPQGPPNVISTQTRVRGI